MYEIGKLDRLVLGRRGETGTNLIQIDFRRWKEQYPTLNIVAWHKRFGDTQPYIAQDVEFSKDGTVCIWRVSAMDTAVEGLGMLEFRGIDPERGMIKLTKEILTMVLPSMADQTSTSVWNEWYNRFSQIQVSVQQSEQHVSTMASEVADNTATVVRLHEEVVDNARQAAADAATASTAANVAQINAQSAGAHADVASLAADKADKAAEQAMLYRNEAYDFAMDKKVYGAAGTTVVLHQVTKNSPLTVRTEAESIYHYSGNMAVHERIHTGTSSNGVTYSTVYVDDVPAGLEFNGTATANVSAYITNTTYDSIYLKAGRYTVSGMPKDGSSTTYGIIVYSHGINGNNVTTNVYRNNAVFTLAEDSFVAIMIRVFKSYKADGLVIMPMLTPVSASREWTPAVLEHRTVVSGELILKAHGTDILMTADNVPMDVEYFLSGKIVTPDGFVNALAIGVVEGGLVDNTEILNEHSKENIYFPSGKYYFTDSVNMVGKVEWRGSDHDARAAERTKFIFKNGGIRIGDGNKTSAGAVVRNISIEHEGFSSSDTATWGNNGIVITTYQPYVQVVNCAVRGFANGIYMSNDCWGTNLLTNIIEHCRNGIVIGNDANEVIVRDNYLHHTETGLTVPIGGISNLVVDSNLFQDALKCLVNIKSGNSTNIVFTSNYFEQHYGNDVLMEDGGGTLEGVYFSGCRFYSGYTDAEERSHGTVLSHAKCVTFVGCRFHKSGSNILQHYVEADTTAQKIVFVGCFPAAGADLIDPATEHVTVI